jgi:hypothetical protein
MKAINEKEYCLARLLFIFTATLLLLIPAINGLETPIIVASERNLSIGLEPNYVIVDQNASTFLEVTTQGMTHAFNITDISNPNGGNAVVAVLSVGHCTIKSDIDTFVNSFIDMVSPIIRLGGGKEVGERIVKNFKGQNVTVRTFDMRESRSGHLKYFGEEFDFALWNIDTLNIAYLTVPSSLGKNVTEKIIGTLKI